MIREQQFEIWVQSGLTRWDMLGCFRDMNLATTVAANHSARRRLICVTFEYGKMISQDLVQELGPIRPAA